MCGTYILEREFKIRSLWYTNRAIPRSHPTNVFTSYRATVVASGPPHRTVLETFFDAASTELIASVSSVAISVSNSMVTKPLIGSEASCRIPERKSRPSTPCCVFGKLRKNSDNRIVVPPVVARRKSDDDVGADAALLIEPRVDRIGRDHGHHRPRPTTAGTQQHESRYYDDWRDPRH